MSYPVGSIYRVPWGSDPDSYALELYRFCSHHCKYCYVKWDEQKRVPWYIKELIEMQLKDLLIKPGGPFRVHLGHFSDPYGAEDTTETRRVLELFKKYHTPFSILSKAGTKAIRDFDLYLERCRFGQSLTFDNDADSKQWEPGAALPADRMDALRQAHDRGIKTWVALEPVIVPAQSIRLIEQTYEFVDFYLLGKLNHHSEIEKKIDWAEFLGEAKDLFNSLQVDFGVKWQLEKAARLQLRS
jgi:DNA repair photolyase